MQMPASRQVPLTIPLTKEVLMLISAVFLAGTITLLGLGIAALLGMCWGLAYILALVLAHTTSTQMLFMCLFGFGLFHVGRGYLQRGKK